MNKENIIDFIRTIEFFRELTNPELEVIANEIEVLKLSANKMVFTEHENREYMYMIYEGEVELFKKSPFGEENKLSYFRRFDFMGEGGVIDDSPHSTSARTIIPCVFFVLKCERFKKLYKEYSEMAIKVLTGIAKVMSKRMSHSNSRLVNVSTQYVSGRTRIETDLLGERQVPAEFYYGIQTLRAVENFNVTGVTLHFYPLLVESLATIKKACAITNYELNLLPANLAQSIIDACDEIISGRHLRHFAVDMIQGGAGNSTNVNANEVIANRALEIMGHEKGEYQYCHPNNHVNLSQSSNDAYPSAVRIALFNSNKRLLEVLQSLIISFRRKANEFSHVLKMGRTHLQDALPMLLGQEFEAWAATLEEERERLNQNANLCLEINIGATTIGTAINVEPEFRNKVLVILRELTGLQLASPKNLVEATQDAGVFIMYSSAVKRLAVKISKICNDLRLMSSGPRCGFFEINIPQVQASSSFMQGKVNPVILEMMNQIAFKVIGNDLTVTIAVESGQLELNVMQPVIVQSLFESIEMMKNGMTTLKYRCIDGITANEEHCKELIKKSISMVSILNSTLGKEICAELAQEALKTNKGVYELVLEKKLLSEAELEDILRPENFQ